MKPLIAIVGLGLALVTCRVQGYVADPSPPVAAGETFTMTDDNYEKEAVKHSQPVLLFFWAEWAGPARMTSPAITEVAKEHAGKLRVGKVNVDNCPLMSQKLGISSIPVILILKGGEVKGKLVGAQKKDKVDAFLREHLGAEFAPKK